MAERKAEQLPWLKSELVVSLLLLQDNKPIISKEANGNTLSIHKATTLAISTYKLYENEEYH